MERKPIAVITGRADDIEQKLIISGIAGAAFALDTDVALFSNVYNHWITDELLNFENCVFSHFAPEHYSGVIVTAEAFMDITILSGLFEKVRSSGIPAVMICGTEPGFITVDTDDEADMELLAEHLITVHGLRDFHILTGRREMPVSRKRVSGCMKAFRKHGIGFDREHIFYGDFWNDSGHDLGKRYLSGELPMPQAVICTNDYMAFGLCDVLTEAGITIPGQLTVTGYDYNDGRLFHDPILTTFRRDRRLAGARAVKLLTGAGELPLPEEERFIMGDSCGCCADRSQLGAELKRARIGQFHTQLSSVAQFTSRLTVCRSLAEYTGVLREYFYLLHSADEMYFCLDKDWNSSVHPGEQYICSTVSHHSGGQAPRHLSRQELLPSLTVPGDRPRLFCVTPLCFQKEEFGLTVQVFSSPDSCYDHSFRDWNKTVSNTLEFLRMKNDIHYLTQCRRESSLYDSLTGFYRPEEFRSIITAADGEELSLTAVRLSFGSDAEYLFGENHRSDMVSRSAGLIKRSAGKHEVFCRAEDELFLILCRAGERGRFTERLTMMLWQELGDIGSGEQVRVTITALTGDISPDLAAEQSRNQAQLEARALSGKAALPHYAALLQLWRQILHSPKKIPSPDGICRKLCISEGYFRIMFKKCFGISYLQHGINCKMMLARYLLLTTAMSISAVAMSCGYTDEKYFDRIFRQNIGLSPMQYRTKYC